MQTYEINIPPFVEELIKEQAYFIATDKPSVAMKWVDRIYNEIYSLEQFPKRCSIAPEDPFINFEVRHLIIGEYRVLFSVKEDIVRILDFKASAQNKPTA